MTSLRNARISRQRFLALTGAGLAGGTLAAVAVPPRPAAAASAESYGISPSNNGTINRNNLVAAVAANNALSITFEPGDYQLDNSAATNPGGGGYIVLLNFAGVFGMHAGARLVFTDQTQGGIKFQNGTGGRFTGLTATYSTLPDTRYNLASIDLESMTNPIVSNLTINGAPGSGFIFGNCVNPWIDTATITDTMADGLDFFNCQDGYANHVTTNNTGDDGLAFVNYYSGANYTGGYATDISVTQSKARGITVIGQSGVTIDSFGVNGSLASGILCATDNSFHTRVPTNVTFQNGAVYNAGTVAGQGGNKYGIEWSGVGEIYFSGIFVTTPGDHGASGTAAAFTQVLPDGTNVSQPAGTVHLTGITVNNTPSGGFNCYGGSYHLDQLIAQHTNDIGFFAASTAQLQYGTLTALDTSKTASLHRAVDFENNASIQGTALHINDDQPTATGYVVGAYGSNSGTLGTIYHAMANGSLQVQNQSGSSLTYTLG